MTEAFPTNFHSFLTRKILTTAEEAAQWMEVSATEKAKLEAADAAWVHPEQAVIDMWNRRCVVRGVRYGQYNEKTGFGELNGLKDITAQQMIDIMQVPNLHFAGETSQVNLSACQGLRVRTIVPPYMDSTAKIYGNQLFKLSDSLEVIRFHSYYTFYESLIDSRSIQVTNSRQMFLGCYALKRVETVLEMPPSDGVSVHFYNSGVSNLEYARIKGIVQPLMLFGGTPRVGIDSLRFAVDNAVNTADIYIAVHADVYAALQGTAPAYPFNGGSREEWIQLLADAAERRISFSTN